MYLNEVKEEDKRITDAWKEDANGILVFVSLHLLVPQFVIMTGFKTGLFSATVGTFIIEFYKKLSSDPGEETVALLRQISQQLPNSTISSQSNTADQSSPPHASMVAVISMWLVSLVFSLTSALIATLLQQWARRYVETPKVPSEPNDRARVRSFLFLGTEKYQMRFLVELAPALLHFSVYLFFAGLVIAFHTVHKRVAIAVYAAVGLFGVAYLVLTVLPFVGIKCPYRTPMSYILWYSLHPLFSALTWVIHWVLEQFRGWLVSPNLGGSMSSGQRRLVGWSNSLETAAKKHWRYVTDGFGKSIIDGAKNLENGDRNIITWLFSHFTLYDRSKLQRFAASIPRNRVPELIPLTESGRIVLRDPLLTLLRSCVPDARATGPDNEDVRKRSLLVYLDTIYHIAKAPITPDLNFMRANFANVGDIRALLDNDDADIRVASHSICALVAKQVIREPLEEPQLRWLQEVTGETSNTIYNASIVARDRMNFKAFVYGVLSNQAGDLPIVSFKETLAILLDVRTDRGTDIHFDMITSRNRLSEEVRWLQQGDPQRSNAVVGRLRSESMFPFLPPPLPPPPPPPPPPHPQ